MLADKRTRVYHVPVRAATASLRAVAVLMLVMGLRSAAAGAVVPTAPAPQPVPSAAAPVLPPAQLEAKLRQAILDMFATPQRLLTVVPLELPPDEMRKTLWAACSPA